MSFPTVTNTSSDLETSGTTSHSITIGAHVSGDLIAVFFTVESGGSQAVSVASGSGGWTIGLEGASSGVFGAFVWKIAGSAYESLVLGTTESQMSTHITQVISPTAGNAIASVDGTDTTGSSTNANPPLHTPAFGSADYLWIVVANINQENIASAAPASYSNLQTRISDPGGSSTSIARRTLNATSTDPGAFTSPDAAWVASTVAIREAAIVPSSFLGFFV
jgi:hypothetical protein